MSHTRGPWDIRDQWIVVPWASVVADHVRAWLLGKETIPL
jgi:hypothetical protein